jgi:hypothetical protein
MTLLSTQGLRFVHILSVLLDAHEDLDMTV